MTEPSASTAQDMPITPCIASLPSEIKAMIAGLVAAEEPKPPRKRPERKSAPAVADPMDVDEAHVVGQARPLVFNARTWSRSAPSDEAPSAVSNTAQEASTPVDEAQSSAPTLQDEPWDNTWHGRTIGALALVNRDFAEIACAHIWKSLDLSLDASTVILHFARNLVPKYGKYVERLWIQQHYREDPEPLLYGKDAYDAKRVEDLVRGRVAFDEWPGDSVDNSYRLNRSASLLAAYIIRSLPASNGIRIHQSVFDKPHGQDGFYADYGLDALRSIGPRLIDLSLANEPCALNDQHPVLSHASTFSDWLSAFPNLERLNLSVRIYDWEGSEELHDTVASMTRLTELKLDQTEWFAPQLASRRWTAPLRVLQLEECPCLMRADLAHFVENFSDTLQVLKLKWAPRDSPGIGRHAVPPCNLPRLGKLVLATEHLDADFELFVNCPVQELETQAPAFGPLRFGPFMATRLKTLKKVTVAYSDHISDNESENLCMFCSVNGIDLLLKPGEVELDP